MHADDIANLQGLYCDVAGGNAVCDEYLPECLQNLVAALGCLKQELSAKSRTAKLWIQYLQFVQNLKTFIRAECTSNWQLYLFAMLQTMNLFAAAGHSDYARCSHFIFSL